MAEDKKLLSLPPVTRDLIERLAKLEGITKSEMMKKMAEFYEMAVSFLYQEGMTPAKFNEYVLGFRSAVLEQGMRVIGEALRNEDQAAMAPLVQRLGKRKFVVPGPTEVIAAELEPSPAAAPEPAQRKIG